MLCRAHATHGASWRHGGTRTPGFSYKFHYGDGCSRGFARAGGSLVVIHKKMEKPLQVHETRMGCQKEKRKRKKTSSIIVPVQRRDACEGKGSHGSALAPFCLPVCHDSSSPSLYLPKQDTLPKRVKLSPLRRRLVLLRKIRPHQQAGQIHLGIRRSPIR